MSEIKDGGAAFPAGSIRKSRPAHDPGADFRVTDIVEPKNRGMTLRDWLAGKAMPAVLAKTNAFDHISDHKTHKLTAKIAYEIADAMIAARSQP